MKIKLIIIISILSFGFSNICVENICSIMFPRGGDEDWGIGTLYIPNEFEVNIYKDTKGNKFGKLKTINKSVRLRDKNGKELGFKNGELEYLGHSTFELIKVKESKSKNYFQVMWKTSKNGLFVNKKEMKDKGAIFYTYKELLFNDSIPLKNEGFYDSVNIGVNLEKSCLNLRKKPSKNSTKIKCILGNDWELPYHTHMQILETKDNWAKVEITEYFYDAESDESGEGCTFFEKNKKTGWLKAIDENGFPNIWFSLTSY